jgi:hypothetical protein
MNLPDQLYPSFLWNAECLNCSVPHLGIDIHFLPNQQMFSASIVERHLQNQHLLVTLLPELRGSKVQTALCFPQLQFSIWVVWTTDLHLCL